MKASEVLRRYAAGERDFCRVNLRGQSFKGHDLSGTDFSNADIRGANFSSTILRGANFAGARTGLQRRWCISLVAGLLFLSTLLDFFAALAGVVAGGTFTHSFLEKGTSSSGEITLAVFSLLLVLIALYILIIHQGFRAPLLIYYVASIMFGTLAWVSPENLWFFSKPWRIIGLTISWGGGGVIAETLFCAVVGTMFGIVLESRVSAIFGTAFSAIVVVLIGALYWTSEGNIFGALIIVGSGVVLGDYISLRALDKDMRETWIQNVAIAFAAIGGTTFRSSDLTTANFTEATLKSANLQDAILTGAYWLNAKKLDRARLGNTYLADPKIRQLVVKLIGQDQNYDGLNLEGVNLQGANLQDACFVGSNLNHANLQDVNLSRAFLKQTQLDGADLTGATLTGAYIEDWGITGSTKLNGVRCEYVYMHVPTANDPDPIRKPDNRKEVFEDGDFADFIKPIVDTLDLYHNQGVDPRAIAIAFKDLAENNAEAELEIVAMEKRGEGKFLLRAKSAPTADKSQLSAEYFTTYNECKMLSPTAQALLAQQDRHIEQLVTMVETALQRSTFYTETNIHEVGIVSNNPGGISQSNSGQMSGSMQAAIGNRNTQISSTETSSTEAIPDTPEVISLLAQLQELIQSSALSEADKTKATTYLEAAKTEATEAEPDKDLFAKNLERTAKTLKTADETMQTGSNLFGKVVPIFKAIAPWIGKAAGVLWGMLP